MSGREYDEYGDDYESDYDSEFNSLEGFDEIDELGDVDEDIPPDTVEDIPAPVKTKAVKGPKTKNYLNNKDMLAELRKCHEQDSMTDEFAKMIMLLADRYGSKFEYSDYSPHIEDMKAMAVMNVVRAWRSFNPEKSNNPFAYFTQAVKHTFWQYVSQEKKHRLNRDALLIDMGELPSDAFLEDYDKALRAKRGDSPDTPRRYVGFDQFNQGSGDAD
jgi:hypothetical protein